MIQPNGQAPLSTPDTASPAGGPRPVWFLLHVPKCAGTTVEQHLQDHLRPEQILNPDRNKSLACHFTGENYSVPPRRDLNQVSVVIGHFIGSSLSRYFPGREILRSALIREPLSWFLSHYNYRMGRYAKRGGRLIPFELYYETLPPNPISHFLLHRYLGISIQRLWCISASRKLQLLDETLSEFSYVGNYTSCGDLVDGLCRALAVPALNRTRNVTPTKFVTETDLPPALRDRIHEENMLDSILFQKYHARGWSRKSTAIDVPPLVDNRWSAVRRDLCRPFKVIQAYRKRGHLGPKPPKTSY